MTMTIGQQVALAREAAADTDFVSVALVDQARRRWSDHGPSMWVNSKLEVFSPQEFVRLYDRGGETLVIRAVQKWKAAMRKPVTP